MLIAYGAGHGMNTPGKRSPNDEREWTFNNVVATAFAEQMKKYGAKLLRTDDPTGKRDVPLIERTNKANKANADLYISFHHNAYLSKWGTWTGTETFYHKGSVEGQKLAQVVQNAALKAYELRDRGIKTNNLHITRETKMPAVLLEGGFMDSEIDIVQLRDNKVLKKAGEMVADAVAEYLGFTSDNKPPKPKPTPAPKPKPTQAKKEKLVVDGYFGPKTISALQRYFGTPVDGYLSNPSLVIKALQKFLGTTVDGYISEPYSMMVAALQRRFGTKVDGYISKGYSLVIAELQRRLNAGKL